MKRAFTIVELLVVLGILAILFAVLLPSLAGATESARAAKCLSNLHNLAAAWDGGPASSVENSKGEYFDESDDTSIFYEATAGWVSADTRGMYKKDGNGYFGRTDKGDGEVEIPPVGMYETDKEKARFAITNGWYFTRTQSDVNSYVCPTHVKLRGTAMRPHWSYFMNAGIDSLLTKGGRSALSNADLTLLFAEIPFQGPGTWFPGEKNNNAQEGDGVLQYSGYEADKGEDAKGVEENIGGNHKMGKQWYAHVAFADGHVEKLRVDGLDAGALRDLTKWLCTGVAVGRNGNKYEEFENKDEDTEE